MYGRKQKEKFVLKNVALTLTTLCGNPVFICLSPPTRLASSGQGSPVTFLWVSGRRLRRYRAQCLLCEWPSRLGGGRGRQKIKYSPVLLTYVVLMWNNLVDGGYHYYYCCWYNHTHELSNVCIEWTLWVLAAHNLVSFLRVVWPSFSPGEPSSPTLNPCDLERASLLGAKNGHVTQTWPISAAQSPGYSWFSNGHVTRAKLMKLDLRTFARDIEEEELFSAGLAKLAEFSL